MRFRETRGRLCSTVNDLLLYAKTNINCKSSSLSNAFGLSHQITFSKGPVVGILKKLRSS